MTVTTKVDIPVELGLDQRKEAPLVLSETFATGKTDDGKTFEIVRFPGSLAFQVRTDEWFVTVNINSVVQHAIGVAVGKIEFP